MLEKNTLHYYRKKDKARIRFNRRFSISTTIIAILCCLGAIAMLPLTGPIGCGITLGLLVCAGVFWAGGQAPYRVEKKLIINNGALIKISNEEDQKPLTFSTAICSKVYYEGQNQNVRNVIKTSLQKRIDECSCYETAPLLAPLMAVLAFAALGRHNNNSDEPNQPLKIILSIHNDLSHLIIHGKKVAGGFLPALHPNTLFVTFGDIDKKISYGISTIFHEGSRFVANLLMKNLSNPCSNTDDEIANQYLTILIQLRSMCNTNSFRDWEDSAKDNKKILEVIEAFQATFYCYSEENQGNELFVLVAQTIAILGYKDGIKWLNQHVPDLVNFWQNHFNPACLNYLKSHNAQQYLAFDRKFTEAINAYEPPTSKLSFSIRAWRTFRSIFTQATLMQKYLAFSKLAELAPIIISLGLTALILAFLLPPSALMPILAITIKMFIVLTPSITLIGYYVAQPIIDKIFELIHHVETQPELSLKHAQETSDQSFDDEDQENPHNELFYQEPSDRQTTYYSSYRLNI